MVVQLTQSTAKAQAAPTRPETRTPGGGLTFLDYMMFGMSPSPTSKIVSVPMI